MKSYRLLLGGVLSAVVLLGAGCRGGSAPSPELPPAVPASEVSVTSTAPNSSTSTAVKSAVVAKAKVPAAKATTTVGVAPKLYIELLTEYKKSGYYIQLSECRALPGVLTVKKGVSFMVDNRDAKQRVINVGPASYTLASYGYAIVKTPATPGTYYITCDGGGSAQLNVQP